MTANGQPTADDRKHILYIAPWMEFGGTSKGTLDWFRWLDRDCFRLSLVTTQPSSNPWLPDVIPYVDEVWPLPELMPGNEMPSFILDFIESRGVDLVHIMDSRLGFDLLPDIRTLSRRPAIVVQLHVEEDHRAGYVRYVTTRYGNLVDAYSVTSRHLVDDIVRDYDIPRGKCRVIYTGIDAEREFSPDWVEPVSLDPGPFHILYPARLVKQKDPGLMVDVAAALAAEGVDFRIHVLGDGELEPDVRSALASNEIEDRVLLQGPQRGIAGWLAAASAVLLTSVFEGIPYVGFEAMAMARPLVAPALPGLVEIVESEEAILIDPRDDVEAYAAALSELAGDPGPGERIGDAGRALVRDRYAIQRMAREHEDLYGELLGAMKESETSAVAQPPPIRCRTRPAYGSPKVSVIVACFDHGHYLVECLESLRRQTYPDVELIVVDDGSTEKATLELLDRLEDDPGTTLIREPTNRGPGAARNVGVEFATGRYILPVDADNLLLPNAIGEMVAQLQGAGEEIAFIYPNYEFFGNRDDYFEAPDYNLDNLLDANFCDTCSLIDRAVFDAGVRYSPDVRMAHEDWDFALQLAARGARGQPALSKTLLFRKRGYSRGDTAWFGIDGAYRAGPLPESLDDNGSYGRRAAVKGRWSPAISVIPLGVSQGLELSTLTAGIRRQTCPDAEVLLRSEDEVPVASFGPTIRRQPPELAGSSAEAMAEGLDAARGRYVLVTHSAVQLFEDPGFFEKVLRTLRANPHVDALAFADLGAAGRFPFRLLSDSDAVTAAPHTLAWELDERPELENRTLGLDPVADAAEALSETLILQWRHFPARSRSSNGSNSVTRRTVRLSRRRPQHNAERREQRLRARVEPRLPSAAHPPPRLADSTTWIPAGTQILHRYRDPVSGSRMVSCDPNPPDGFGREHDLGVALSFPLPGTARLTATQSKTGQAFEVSEVPADRSLESPGLLGHVDRIAMPMFSPLEIVRDPKTGETTLACGYDDPLRPTAESVALLGWIDSFPIAPKQPPHHDTHYSAFGMIGLIRTVDQLARRHRYGVGEAPEGEISAELGSLLTERPPDAVEMRIDAIGRVFTSRYSPVLPPASPRQAARWALAPLNWRDEEIPTKAAVRATLRRTSTGARHLVSDRVGSRSPTGARGAVIGYLHPTDGPGRRGLFSSIHPVTGDQLLSTSQDEGSDMGYARTTKLGYLLERAPVTTVLGIRSGLSVPWASRFGRRARIQ